MATKAIIGVVQKDDSFDAAIVHYDGMPNSAGETLAKHYTTPEQVNQLIEGGDLRTLGDTLDTCEFYKNRHGEQWDNIKPREYRNFGHFLNHQESVDYLDYFDGKQWHYKN